MKHNNPGWNRLAEAARGAPETRDASAPYGFSTRVAALAFATERPTASPFASLALRAMGVSCLLALLAVAANFSSVQNLFGDSGATEATAAAAATAAMALPDDPMNALADLATS